MADLNTALNALAGFPQLRGPRVQLRGPRMDDAQAIFALFSDPQVMRYWSSAPMRELAQAEGRVEEMLEAFAQRQMLHWVIADKDDEVIGTCSLFHFEAKQRCAEIGFALRPQHWSKGLAGEAATLAIEWAFRVLGLHRIAADIHPRNDASRRMLESLGFTCEGLLRGHRFVRDEPTESEIFGLLSRDWQGRH